MIVSASYRTDIPAFHGRWFLDRLADGVVTVPNPYGGKPSVVSLRPESVDGYIFWTRNAKPFLPGFEAVAAQGVPFLVSYTVTGYPAALDGVTPGIGHALAVMAELRRLYGPKAVVWRYDPIVFSDATPPAWHRQTFARLSGALAGITDSVVVSVLQPYRKALKRLDDAAIGWRDPAPAEKRALIGELAGLARDAGMTLSLCAQPELVPDGVAEAACVDAGRLADIKGAPLKAAAKPHRDTCRCAQSRDIGQYDTCPNGCAYCYAVQGRIPRIRPLT